VVSDNVAKLLAAFVTPPKNGKRKISTNTLSPPRKRLIIRAPSASPPFMPPTSPSSAASPYIRPEDFEAYYTCEEASDIEVPEVLESSESLEFISFSKGAADYIYNIFVKNTDADFQDSFLGTALQFLRMQTKIPDCTSQDEDWDGAMAKLGINERLRKAILHPAYSDLRYTNSMKVWVEEAIENGFLSLESLDKRMLGQSPRLLKSGPKIASVPSSSGPKGRKHTIGDQDKPTSPFKQDQAGANPTPVVKTTTGAPKTLNHHTMIWHATTLEKANQLYDTDTGEISLNSCSGAPGDFSGNRKVCYWTPQRACADRYASWKKIWHQICDIAVVQLAVPETVTNSLHKDTLYCNPRAPSDDWRKICYASRCGDDWPKEFKDRWTKGAWLMGHILSGKEVKYERKKDHTQIKDSDALMVMIDGRKTFAMQWVIKTRDGIDKFEEKCKGKGWILNMGAFMQAMKDDELS
jgi:hypothetical protein